MRSPAPPRSRCLGHRHRPPPPSRPHDAARPGTRETPAPGQQNAGPRLRGPALRSRLPQMLLGPPAFIAGAMYAMQTRALPISISTAMRPLLGTRVRESRALFNGRNTFLLFSFVWGRKKTAGFEVETLRCRLRECYRLSMPSPHRPDHRKSRSWHMPMHMPKMCAFRIVGRPSFPDSPTARAVRAPARPVPRRRVPRFCG